MEARLKAIMELDASDVQKELIRTSNELKKFERELARTTDTNEIGRITGRIRELNADMARLTVTANGTAKSMTAVGAATKTASTNSMNFARVIQDLPFGFMGIQNNLTQLIPGIGAAGIAFSALTAAITFSQVGLSYWSRGAKDAQKSASDLAEFTKEFAKNSADEAVKAKLLYEASNNVAISMDKRLRAAKELKEMYPTILSNYSAEDIALGKAKKGYDELTKSIVANAKAQAATSKITELQAEINQETLYISRVKGQTDKEIAEARIKPMRRIDELYRKEAVVQSRIEVIEKRRNDDLEKRYARIKKLTQAQEYFEKLAGGATAMQEAIIPAPDAPKSTTSSIPKDMAMAAEIARTNDFSQRKGKWWRNTQTERGNDLSATPDIKVRIEENATLNKILAERAQLQQADNDAMMAAAEIAEYGGQVFGQMVQAMMNGEAIGDVLANAFKQIATQIAAAVAQALIFAALLEAFPALKGVFATTGAIAGNGGGGNILGAIRGQDIQLSNRRTSTGMGFRRGRR